MIVRFGRCEVDLGRVEIRVDGRVVPVQPQVFDVIAYLSEHRDRVVTKEELLDNVWGDRFVSESALTSRIKSARRALDDTGRDQSVIRTVHGRGYRFVADAELIGDGLPASTAAGSPVADRPRPSRERPADDPSGSREQPWPFVGRHDQLDDVLARVADQRAAGVLFRNAGGSGATRLLAECVRACEAEGHRTATASGSATAASIPLAALASLLPDDVLDVGGVPGDIGRGVVFRRAHAALEALAPPGGRLVLALDDADQLDELSEAVVASLVRAGSLFVVATHRPVPHRAPIFDDLIRSELVAHVDLPALGDTDVDIILYRVLEGPIDLASLERLSRACAGRPGVLRDLVDSSTATGALTRDGGVWRLVGPVASRTAAAWPPPGLPADAVRAAEQLALAGTLHLDDAMRILGDGAVDVLDAARLLALDVDVDGDIVSLADPVLRDAVVTSIGPLRARGLKQALVDELLTGRRRPDDIATAAAWADELGRTVDPIEALLAARSAMRRGRDDAAEVLVDHLDRVSDGPNPYALTIRAELCYRRAQFARAAQLFDSVDLAALDDMTAGFVIRRRTAIDYQTHQRYRENVDWLRTREADASPAMRASLAVHRLTFMTLLGDADDVIAESAPLVDEVSDLLLLELRLGRARAMLMRGAVGVATSELDEIDRLVSRVDVEGPERAVLREASLFLRLGVLTALGEIEHAVALVRDEEIAGRRAARSWVPLLAAEIELEAGRPRAALEMVLPAVEAARRLGFDNAVGAAESVHAWVLAALGDHDASERLIESAVESLPRQAGANAWHMTTSLGRTLAALASAGYDDASRRRWFGGMALAHADEAGRRGAVVSDATLALAAAVVDPASAAAAVERVERAARAVGGRIWPVRLDHVRAVAAGAPLGPVADAYHRLGYHHAAGLAASAGRR